MSIAPAAALGASSSAHRSSCSVCGHNLIKNPGAEAGKGSITDSKVVVPHWKAHGNFTAAAYRWTSGDISKSTPGPKHRGKNYFYGGPAGPRHATGTQLISLAHVGGGKVHFKLSGWLGGFSSQRDNAKLTARFENAKGTVLSSASIGPVTPKQRKNVSELLRRSTSGRVPAGTTQVSVTLTLTRRDVSDDDGMADKLSLKLSAH
jgi:hypothetical protein